MVHPSAIGLTLLKYQMKSPLGEILIGETQLIASDRSAHKPAIEFDSKGKLHLTWSSQTCIVGGTCNQAPYEIEYAVINPKADDQNGSAALSSQIFTVPPRVVSSADGFNSFLSQLSVDLYGDAHLIWQDQKLDPLSAGTSSLRYAKLNGLDGTVMLPEAQKASLAQGWSSKRPYSSIRVDQREGVHFVWSDKQARHINAYYYTMFNGASGTNLIGTTLLRGASLIYSQFPEFPHMDVDNLNRVHVLIRATTGFEYIRLVPYATPMIGDPALLSDLEDMQRILTQNINDRNYSTENALMVGSAGEVFISWISDQYQVNQAQVNYQQLDSTGAPLFSTPIVLKNLEYAPKMHLGPSGLHDEITLVEDMSQSRVTIVRHGSYNETRSFQLLASATLHANVQQIGGGAASAASVMVGARTTVKEGVTDISGNFTMSKLSLLFGSEFDIQAKYRSNTTSLVGHKKVFLLPGDNLTSKQVFVGRPSSPSVDLAQKRLGVYADWDTSTYYHFPEGFNFPFFGKLYSGLYIGSNGRVHFEYADGRSGHNLSDLLLQPQIDPWMTKTGEVSYYGSCYMSLDLPGKVAITWRRVPHSGNYGSSQNTFQLVLFDTGQIQFNYGEMTHWYEPSAVGLSAGVSIPNKITTVDFTGAPLKGGSERVIYEDFGISDFDIRYSVINFTPNVEGGFDVKLTPMSAPPLY